MALAQEDIVRSRSSTDESRWSFNEYIIRQLEGRVRPNTPIDIYHEDSKKVKGIQIIDMFIWGIHRKYELLDSEWYKIFADKVALDEMYLK